MVLQKVKKDDVKQIEQNLHNRIVNEALFRYYCPDDSKRKGFIDNYFNYYLYEWSEYDTLLCSDNKQALLTLVNPRTFEYTFKGKGAWKLKRDKDASKAIFRHRKIVRSNVHIIAPGSMNPRVMNIYANPQTNLEDINALVDEAIELAKQNEITLVYETLSRKLISLMTDKGFSIAYQKHYYDTHFVQTIMVLSCKRSKHHHKTSETL
jgi:hypothetical protein